jgi:hypothetical protein
VNDGEFKYLRQARMISPRPCTGSRKYTFLVPSGRCSDVKNSFTDVRNLNRARLTVRFYQGAAYLEDNRITIKGFLDNYIIPSLNPLGAIFTSEIWGAGVQFVWGRFAPHFTSL